MIVVSVLMGLLALTVLGALHWYLWRRLVRDTTRPGSVGWWLGTGVIVIGAVLMVAALVAQFARAPMSVVRIVSWPGFLWAALVIYLLIGVLIGELLRPLVMRWYDGVRGDGGEPAGAAGPAPAESAVPQAAVESGTDAADPLSRRLFVSRVLGGAVVAAAVGTVGLGTYNVLSGPAVKRMTVLLPKLPADADGFRITLVSDLHVGPALGRSFTRRVVEAVNGTDPDLIAVAGDLVDGRVADLRATVAPLAELRSRLGTYYVTGNHEYYSGADEWVEHVQELGMRVLMNSRVELPGFDLAGVDDVEGEAEGRGPDVAAALAGRDATRACVLLAHQPVVIHDAVDHGVDLQLSGHTHGGQLFPGNLIADLANPTLAGLERYGDTQLYVTRGAGAWGPPVRVAAPSDITVLELRTVRDRVNPSPR
ncbi:metallophosphoesterase [Nocardia cyriacigeorgica]|uniref:metallophosphoesterase n=1 Tax=Nocardia cyriacigeorgica TaxID=135487 RepID=UPI0013D42245|nr:metallophosphoesterase [Nocardia cyriacigeorgica]NEW27016.1 metallophosphoesterase [Nocardia cyriacigeorgica]